MNIGGLYYYPVSTMNLGHDLWDTIKHGAKCIGYLQLEEPFVVLEEHRIPHYKNAVNLKVLTIKGVIGWIGCVDKRRLLKPRNP